MAINLHFRANTHQTEISHAIEVVRHFMQETRLQESSLELDLALTIGLASWPSGKAPQVGHWDRLPVWRACWNAQGSQRPATASLCCAGTNNHLRRHLSLVLPLPRNDSTEEATCACNSGRCRRSVSTSLNAPFEHSAGKMPISGRNFCSSAALGGWVSMSAKFSAPSSRRMPPLPSCYWSPCGQAAGPYSIRHLRLSASR